MNRRLTTTLLVFGAFALACCERCRVGDEPPGIPFAVREHQLPVHPECAAQRLGPDARDRALQDRACRLREDAAEPLPRADGAGVDWHGFVLPAARKGAVNCSGGSLYNPTTQHPSYVTLAYGKTWRQKMFSCTSQVERRQLLEPERPRHVHLAPDLAHLVAGNRGPRG